MGTLSSLSTLWGSHRVLGFLLILQQIIVTWCIHNFCFAGICRTIDLLGPLMSCRIFPSSICNFLATFLTPSVLLVFKSFNWQFFQGFNFYAIFFVQLFFSFFFFFWGGVLCIIKWWKKQTQRTQIYTLFDSLLDPASVRQQCPSWFIWCADLFLNNWHAIPLFLHRNVENNLFSGPIPEKLLDIPNFRWRTNYLLVYFTPKFIRYTCAFMEKRMYKTYG